MRLLNKRYFRALGWTAAAVLCLPVAAAASVVLEDAWVRAMPPGQSVTALYFTATNHSGQACALTAVTTTEARRTELHRTTEEDGIARMRLQEAIDIPAGAQAKLSPGGDHVMLFDVVRRLGSGDVVHIELDFGSCGQTTVEADVRSASGGHAASHHHHH